jgi:hypothetical protein
MGQQSDALDEQSILEKIRDLLSEGKILEAERAASDALMVWPDSVPLVNIPRQSWGL